MSPKTGMPRSQVTLVLVALVVLVIVAWLLTPLTCISPVAAAADSVILRPCTQRPAKPSAMSWRLLPWAIALSLTCIVVADLLPAR